MDFCIYFSVRHDESTDNTSSAHLVITVRFVKGDKIRKEPFRFAALTRITIGTGICNSKINLTNFNSTK
jgi:hypothetical protein